jgi:tyrosine-protein kinase Etk/Wzc
VVVQPHRFPLIGGFIARHYSPDKPGDVASPWFGISRDDWGGATLDVYQLDVPDGLLGKTLTLVAGEHGAYTLRDPDGHTLLQGQVGQAAQGHGVTMQVKTLYANPGMRFDVTRNPTLSTVIKLQGEIGASEQGKDSGIIQLTYENADPKRAVAVLDQVQQAYVRQNVEKNSAQAANSLKFVKQQLPQVREHLDAAQAALNNFQIKAHSVNVDLQTKALLDQVVAIDTSIQQLQLQQADVARRFTKNHPAYKALMQQIGSLDAQKAKIEQQIDHLPDTQKQLLRLTEDVQVSNTTYTGLLNEAQQLEIARAGTVGNVRVIDPAATDVTHPAKPRRAIVVVGGTFLGAFLAVAFVFLRQMLNRGVEDPAEIEKIGLPVYAAVPLSTRELAISEPASHRHGDGRQRLLAVDTPADLAIEALRSLRTSLHFARLEAGNNLLMISGSSPNAGKTFVSANLAAVIAQSGQRVLVVDADLRKGGVHRVLGGRPENGLSELISGQVTADAAIRPVDNVEGLFFLPRGAIPPNPSELLMHQACHELLTRFMQAYDIVIVDTPPILAVTDASVIGQYAGISLLVARFGMNQVRELDLARQRFLQNGVKIRGVVFNAVEKRASGYYSYGYYEYKSARS